MFYAGDEYADDDTTSGPLESCEPFSMNDEPDLLDDVIDRISAVFGTVELREVDQ